MQTCRFVGLAVAVVALAACTEAGPVAPTEDRPQLATTEGVSLEAVPQFALIDAINERGEMAGRLPGEFSSFGPFGYMDKHGRVTELPPVEGRPWQFVREIADDGTILGGNFGRQWLWHKRRGATLLPADFSWLGMNNRGVVVGHRWNATSTAVTSARWDGTVHPLAGSGAALDINDEGAIVGFDVNWPIPEAPWMLVRNVPILWDRSGTRMMLDYVDLDFGAVATAISNRGHIVGWASDRTPISAVRWHKSENPSAPFPYEGVYLTRGGYSEAVRVNDHGVILGFHETAYQGAPLRGAVWLPDGRELELGTLGGIDLYPSIGFSLDTQVGDLTNKGVIVGASPSETEPHGWVGARWTIPEAWWITAGGNGKGKGKGKEKSGKAQRARRSTDRMMPVSAAVLGAAAAELAAAGVTSCTPAVSERGARALAACALLASARGQ